MSPLSAQNARHEGLLWQGYSSLCSRSRRVLPARRHVFAQSAIYQLFIFAAPVAIVVVCAATSRAVAHWLLFAGGLALWGFGDPTGTPTSGSWEAGAVPVVCDFAYLAAYPLFLAGMLVLVRGWGRPASATCWMRRSSLSRPASSPPSFCSSRC